jgi:hypothetical protein
VLTQKVRALGRKTGNRLASKPANLSFGGGAVSLYVRQSEKGGVKLRIVKASHQHLFRGGFSFVEPAENDIVEDHQISAAIQQGRAMELRNSYEYLINS